MSWKLVGDIAFYAATVSSVLFAVMYLLLAPWRATVAGRNIMAVMGSVAVAFAYFSFVIAQGGIPPGFDVARAFIFVAIASAIGWRTVIFIRHHIIRSLRGPEQGDSHELEDAR